MISTVLNAAAGKPVILVIVGGGAVCLSDYANDDRVSAIIFTGYPGQAGGVGVAEAIFGAFSPSGRLTQTFYRESFVNEVSFFDMNMRRAKDSDSDSSVHKDAIYQGNPGRTYRFYRGNSIVYPFGHGLSYSTFTYALTATTTAAAAAADSDSHVNRTTRVDHNVNVNVSITLNVTVANTGKRRAADTVLVFLIPPVDAPDSAPLQSLRAFDKVVLDPLCSETLSFHLTHKDFSLADKTGKLFVMHGKWTAKIGSLLIQNIVV